MIPILNRAVFILAVVLASCVARAQTPTGFTYQGQLSVLGEPYTGTADISFTPWDAPELGSPLDTAHDEAGVAVNNGLFKAALDFGARVFADQAYLEIAVRTPAWNGQGSPPPFTTLTPRQRITASPYAIQTRGIFVGQDPRRVGIGTAEPFAGFQTEYPAEWKGLHVVSPEVGTKAVGLFEGNDWSRIHLRSQTASSNARSFVIDNTAGLALFRWLNDNLSVRSTPLTLSPTGNVGIGTPGAPQARLDIGGTPGVDGIRFPDGSMQTAASNIRAVGTPLRLVRGVVSFGSLPAGAIIAGSGFTMELLAPGDYRIVFNQPWTTAPNVIAEPVVLNASNAVAFPDSGQPANSSIWRVRTTGPTGVLTTMNFSVLAVGEGG